jgi:hypothetical protein
VTSAPLFVRTEIIRLSRFSARPIAPLKTAHSKRFATPGGVSAERRILLLHFSDGGFLPKAATLRNSRSVWTAVTSAPLFVRTEIIRLSKFSARSTAPAKADALQTLRDIR